MASRTAAVVVMAALLAAGCAAPATTPFENRVAERVEAWRLRGGVPAVVAMVKQEGRAPLTVVRGGAVPDEGPPVSVATQFRIASITKLFVATVVMSLVEDGAVGLDTPVEELVAFPPAAGVSVRQLLDHTSGLPDYGIEQFTQGLMDDPERRWETREVLDTVADGRRSFAPGASYEYSNTNYLVLAELIEAVTGRAWYEELRSRVLAPLGLDDTYVAGLEPARGDGVIEAAYFDLDNDGQVEDIEDGAWPALETSEGAAGALVSTAGDVARFTEALFTGRILPATAVETMVSGGPFARRYDDYGLGVELRHPDLLTPVWGHGGFLPGYRSVTWYVPSERTTITVLVNHSGANPADLATLLLGELRRPATSS